MTKFLRAKFIFIMQNGHMEASDGSGSTSSNISKRKKSRSSPGKVPEPTAASNRHVICPTGEG